MSTLEMVIIASLAILTFVLSAVGYQLYFLLKELRQTNVRINDLADDAENKLNAVTVPLQQIGGAMSGIKSSLRVVDAFVGWLNKPEEIKSK